MTQSRIKKQLKINALDSCWSVKELIITTTDYKADVGFVVEHSPAKSEFVASIPTRRRLMIRCGDL